jgi:predicted short-subunit dehydrogenase-like oxidoreductase (DUF2520 family)
MNQQVQLGLIIEGNSTHSEILRLPSIVQELGPVKSSSFRVARRHSNQIRAGYPIAGYDELQLANLTLIKVADSSVSRVVEELCASDLPLRGSGFALCESWLPSTAFAPLTRRGANVATVLKLPSLSTPRFAVEGDGKAVRQTKRFLARNGARSIELSPEHKHLVFASELLAMSVPILLLTQAKQLLREAGLSGNVLWDVLDQMARKTVLDFSRGSRVEAGGPLAECPSETTKSQLALLERTQPSIASMIREHLRSLL